MLRASTAFEQMMLGNHGSGERLDELPRGSRPPKGRAHSGKKTKQRMGQGSERTAQEVPTTHIHVLHSEREDGVDRKMLDGRLADKKGVGNEKKSRKRGDSGLQGAGAKRMTKAEREQYKVLRCKVLLTH